MEEVISLNIHHLKRQGCLRPGYIGTISWSYYGQRTASIRLQTQYDRLILTYWHGAGGHNAEAVRDTVWLDWTPCHYGGQRSWFRCPGCHRRVAVLCGPGKWFLCRHCYRLSYASQNETRSERMLRKLQKIRERLGERGDLAGSPLGAKPKGMHWRTYGRLIQQEAQVHAAMLGALRVEIDWLEARCLPPS